MSATESVLESPAIRALGPLFRITEVFLWDDALVCNALVEESTSSCTTADVNSSIKHTIDDYTSVEDFELAQQMDALGLPISFSITKEKKNVASKGKRKGMQAKSVSADKGIENGVPGVSRFGQWEDIASSRVLHDSTNILACGKTAEGEIEASYHNVFEDHVRGDVHSDGGSISVDATVLSEIGKKQVGEELADVVMTNYVEKEFTPDDTDVERILEHSLSSDGGNFLGNVLEDARSGVHQEGGSFNKQVQDNFLEGSSISCHITGATNDGALNSCPSSMESLSCVSVDHDVQDYPDISVCCDFGDWRVVWDPFYKRNYFYNFRSQESTWYPPSGLEHCTYSCSISASNEMSADAAEVDAGIGFACDAIQDKDLHGLHDRTNFLQENGNDFEYLNQSSEEISSMMSYGRTVNFGSEHSDEHTTVYKIADKRVSLHVKDHATDDVDDSEYLQRQEKNVTCCDAWSVPDVTLKSPLSNRFHDSLTTALNEVDSDENRSNLPETCMISTMDELDSHHEIATKIKKKRVRRPRSQLTLQGVIEGLSANIVKYWCQRYLLFSRFDYGIKMDEEGWFSVTPEPIARHHASRCGSGTVIDCFTGVGGNAIQFAVKCNHVIAIDIDPKRIEYAQHNAAIYGVSNRIDFVKGDFFQIAPRLKGDVIFMSPPWGGPDYNKVQTYDIRSMLKPHDGHYLFKIASMVASKVVMFLPRNVDLNQLAELSLSVNPPWALEVEKSFLNGKLKAITAYFDNPTK